MVISISLCFFERLFGCFRYYYYLKMRTSYTQFLIMVEFMENNGDLSKPSGGPRGRQWCNKKWQELTAKLNSEGSGDSRTEEKWRKVWSDFKNNTKKKCAKINRAARGTGGGPALRVTLTDLEERVMAIIGEQAAIGLAIPEAGLQDQIQNQTSEDIATITIPDADTEQFCTEEIEVERPISALPYTADSDWNLAGSSSQPTPMRPQNIESVELPATPIPQRISTPPPRPAAQIWKPPPKKIKKIVNTKVDSYKYAFLDAEKRAREYEKERDKMFCELERERIRQRDIELHLQAQWLEFMKEALNVMKTIMEAKKSD